VAAYSLGLLDQKDREDFEAHLAGCPSCAAELPDFSTMAELFAGMSPVTDEAGQPDEAAVVDLVTRRAVVQRRHGRRRAGLAAAASIVLLAGGAAAGLGLAPHEAPAVAALHVVGQRHSATNPVTGIKGIVGLEVKPWGTMVTMDLSKVRGPLNCELIAVSKTGQRRVMVGWFVPRAGYGVPGHPAHLLLAGGTSIPRPDLSAIEIQVHGSTLLTIPI
jgi:hypothetical protein